VRALPLQLEVLPTAATAAASANRRVVAARRCRRRWRRRPHRCGDRGSPGGDNVICRRRTCRRTWRQQSRGRRVGKAEPTPAERRSSLAVRWGCGGHAGGTADAGGRVTNGEEDAAEHRPYMPQPKRAAIGGAPAADAVSGWH